LLILK
jgi:hypothetical protein